MIVAFYASTGMESGKDTCADFAQEWCAANGRSTYRTAFARQMKLVCADALGIKGDDDERVALIDRIKLHGYVAGYDDLGQHTMVTGRDFIIGLAGDHSGENGIRRLAPDFWIEHTVPAGVDADHVLITDLRFQNEADWVHARGGLVVDVWRPDRENVGKRSEAGIHPRHTDWLIHNDHTLEALRAEVYTFCEDRL